MTFKEWFTEEYGEQSLEKDSGFFAEYAWATCKREILKIIKNKKSISTAKLTKEINKI